MPIIRPEISCHPEDLLVVSPAQVPHRRWIVVQTLARQEKSLGRDLLQRDIPFYLPLVSRRLNYQGSKAVSYVPLFSGTLFCFANEAERRICLETHRVASTTEVTDQSGLQNDLRRIANALSQDGYGDLPNHEWLFRRIQMTEAAQR
jgi:hypothetical protein